MEQLGGVVQCVAQRECVSYFLDTFKNNISESLDILAGAAIDSTFPDEEIENGRDMLLYSQEMVPPEMLSRDVRDVTFHKIAGITFHLLV